MKKASFQDVVVATLKFMFIRGSFSVMVRSSICSILKGYNCMLFMLRDGNGTMFFLFQIVIVFVVFKKTRLTKIIPLDYVFSSLLMDTHHLVDSVEHCG